MSTLGRQFTSFLLVGGIATFFHYMLLILLVEAFAVPAVPASAAGAFLGAVISYILNHRMTFKSDKKHRIAVPRFFIVAAVSLFLNTALMALLTGPVALAYLIAQVITTVLLIIVTFGANKLWTFGDDDAMRG